MFLDWCPLPLPPIDHAFVASFWRAQKKINGKDFYFFVVLWRQISVILRPSLLFLSPLKQMHVGGGLTDDNASSSLFGKSESVLIYNDCLHFISNRDLRLFLSPSNIQKLLWKASSGQLEWFEATNFEAPISRKWLPAAGSFESAEEKKESYPTKQQFLHKRRPRATTLFTRRPDGRRHFRCTWLLFSGAAC